jgi:hypothetical protein
MIGGFMKRAEQLPDGDGPPGFWWGTDSLPVNVPGSAPYSMPYLGGAGNGVGDFDQIDATRQS